MTDEQIERVARALCKEHGGDPDHVVKGWRHGTVVDGMTVLCHHPAHPQWKRYAMDARAAIEAMQ